MRRAVVFKALYPWRLTQMGESGPVVRLDCATAHLMLMRRQPTNQ